MPLGQKMTVTNAVRNASKRRRWSKLNEALATRTTVRKAVSARTRDLYRDRRRPARCCTGNRGAGLGDGVGERMNKAEIAGRLAARTGLAGRQPWKR